MQHRHDRAKRGLGLKERTLKRCFSQRPLDMFILALVLRFHFWHREATLTSPWRSSTSTSTITSTSSEGGGGDYPNKLETQLYRQFGNGQWMVGSVTSYDWTNDRYTVMWSGGEVEVYAKGDPAFRTYVNAWQRSDAWKVGTIVFHRSGGVLFAGSVKSKSASSGKDVYQTEWDDGKVGEYESEEIKAMLYASTDETYDSHIPDIHIGAEVSADLELGGTYYDGVVKKISRDCRSVKIEYDDSGLIETLPSNHVRERSYRQIKHPVYINERIFANWKLAGNYYAGTVIQHNGDSFKIQFDHDDSKKTHELGDIRIPWRSLNLEGKISARSLGFTDESWNRGAHPAAHLTSYDSLSTKEQNAARYLDLESHFISFAPPLSICFVSASYGEDASELTPHQDVTRLRELNPEYHFFLFTNLEDLPERGWNRIITQFPYNRFITHSRYGKFLAWKEPMIQELCQVVFYHDTTLVPKDDPIVWQNVAKDILNAPHGLMQVPHSKRNTASRKEGIHVLTEEMNAILRSNKDTASHVSQLSNWLSEEKAFAEVDMFMYVNDFFGYDPKSPDFQRVSQRFWDRYSQELDSWRDQPPWTFYMHSEQIKPLLVQNTQKSKMLIEFKRSGHNGHEYDLDSDKNALRWYTGREKTTKEQADLDKKSKKAAILLGSSKKSWKIDNKDHPVTLYSRVDPSKGQQSTATDLRIKQAIGNSSVGREGQKKTLFFISQKLHYGSVRMRGNDFIDEWTKNDQLRPSNGASAQWEYGVHECGGILPCADICVFIGPCDKANCVRDSCCKIKVLDVVDKYLYKKDIIDESMYEYDALVVNNNYMKEYFLESRKFPGEVFVVLHHSDPRWHNVRTITTSRTTMQSTSLACIVCDDKESPFQIEQGLDCATDAAQINDKCNKDSWWEETKYCRRSCYKAGNGYRGDVCCDDSVSNRIVFGYSGSLPSLKHTDNFLHWQQLIKHYPISFVDTDDGDLPEEVDFKCDLSIRPLGTAISQFKTSAEIATAAAMGHNIISTWDEAVRDSLPGDYPFLLRNSSLGAVREMMDKVSADYKGERHLWNSATKMMKEANAKLSLSNIASVYRGHLMTMLESKGRP